MPEGLQLNSTVGRYRLTEFIGQGGMGQVYLASHVDSGEQFAVKVLSASAHNPSSLARFRNEAIIQYNLPHPSIARLYEYVEAAGRPCIVMEYVDGLTLEEYLHNHGAFPSRDAMVLFRELVTAISFIHGHSVVHRDLKATNVKITSKGLIKILDFGIAYEENVVGLTRVGHIIGTLENLAPEQVLGAKGDVRSDIWAMGVLLYQMVTNRMPFTDTEVEVLAAKIMRGVYTPAKELVPSIPSGVNRIIDRCLKKKAADRFQSADEVLAAIDRATGAVKTDPLGFLALSPPVLRFFRNPWTWGLAGLAAAGVLTWQLFPTAPGPAAVPIINKTVARSSTTQAPRPTQETKKRVETGTKTVQAYRPPADRPTPIEYTPPVEPAPRVETPAPVNPQPQPPPNISPKGIPTVARPGGKQILIVVETTNVSANVYMDGILLGETPRRIGATAGMELHLVLRRAGYQDKPVTIIAGDRPKPYRYLMERK